MMPDLGKYAVEVLSAYAASLVLIAGIVALSLRRSARIRRELKDIEARQKRNG
jgi:heme exporter protein D